MGVPVSLVAVTGFNESLPSPYVTTNDSELRKSKEVSQESVFDKLYVYPIFAPDRRAQQKCRNQVPLKPIVMMRYEAGKEPQVIDTLTILRNLDATGNLEKNSAVLTSLLVAQFEEDLVVNYGYGFSRTTGKCYFFKQGNFDMLLSKVANDENMNRTNLPSKKVFLMYLHQFLNSLSGSVWLNGYCISGPEDPSERILVDSMGVNTIPAKVTIWVKHLSGIHCVRTKNRLEIYARTADDKTKAIWFRGEFANSLVVSDVENGLMSILIPPYCQYAENVKNV